MKYQKPSADEIARRNKIRAIRQLHYEKMSGVAARETSRAAESHASDAATSDSVTALSVSKGPRGKWYVKRGRLIVTGPFETEADASEVMAREPA